MPVKKKKQYTGFHLKYEAVELKRKLDFDICTFIHPEEMPQFE